MDMVTLKTSELLEILKKNRAEHREIFEEAMEGFRKQVIELFEHRLDEARQGREINLKINLVRPADHTKSYDRAIRMCEMHQGDTVELSNEGFANFVMDDWHWTDQFMASNSPYSSKARLKGG